MASITTTRENLGFVVDITFATPQRLRFHPDFFQLSYSPRIRRRRSSKGWRRHVRRMKSKGK